MKKRIGFIGVGAMGSGMAANFVKNGYSVTAYDTVIEHVKAIKGVKAAESPQQVGADSDVIISSLPNGLIVENVLMGEQGALSKMEKGGYIFDMSTIDPATARKLAQLAAEKEIHFLDCPVSGGPTGALNGTLTSMVGGKKEEFEVAKEILSCFCANVIHVGEVGSGQVVKICNNILVADITVALGEALLTGTQAGVKLEVLAEVISKSSGRSFTMDYFAPNSIYKGDYDNPLFMLRHMYKDVSLFTAMAKEFKIPALMGNLTNQLYSSAMEQGWENQDHTSVCKMIEKLANKEIIIE